ncbi:Hypothetical_protein [Hexamita inflata]|uniref:Hypothetical_protein n=1 Tax=Hexamita inflata TaxID=28002 RepID=A0AA86Q9D3_9EUKA|nr:Hypothetical protein HINF_LOCUS36234 [Hexamita inflata]
MNIFSLNYCKIQYFSLHSTSKQQDNQNPGRNTNNNYQNLLNFSSKFSFFSVHLKSVQKIIGSFLAVFHDFVAGKLLQTVESDNFLQFHRENDSVQVIKFSENVGFQMISVSKWSRISFIYEDNRGDLLMHRAVDPTKRGFACDFVQLERESRKHNNNIQKCELE